MNRSSNGMVTGLALVACASSMMLCRQVLGLIPHIPDEISYAFQGRILASGRFWLNTPAVPEAFAMHHILMTAGRWCSVYPPGWPLLLALGWLIHAPWIINPLLLLVSILGIYRLAVRLFDRQTAFVAVVLFCISPFVLMMSAGFMSHQATLCFSVWCLVFLSEDRTRWNGFIAGLLGGYAFLIRPYTAIALLLPAFLWAILRSEKRRATAFLLFAGLAPGVVCFLAYNQFLFGNALQAGYALDPLWKYKGPDTSLFFSKLHWFSQNLNHSVWGLPFGDLWLVLPSFFTRAFRRRVLLLLACCLTLLFGYCFYYYSDIVYGGPRFAYEMVGFLCILAAVSILTIARAFRNRMAPVRIVAGTIGTALIFCPLALKLPDEIRYHSQIYHGQSASFLTGMRKQGVGKNALIFLKGNDYVLGSFFFTNALIPSEGASVFVRDVPAKREELLKEFPRVETWSVEIQLQPLPGPNSYTDRWRLQKFICKRD